MSYLKDRKILLGVTGSIAAYKAAELIRLLKDLGAEVKVVMTQDACEFITPLSLQALCGQPIYQKLLDHDSEASMSHITLAKWAEILLIAPATANIMAKMASGLADDLLSTLYLACSAPVAIVPAMNQQMWRHPATIRNKAILCERGTYFWGPEYGSQACGDIGPGRMMEPGNIISHLEDFFAPKSLQNFKILITAGPTQEPIDPVRYISNHSSGKMGYALASVAQQLGAETYLISGPTNLEPPRGVHTLYVQTAQEMHSQVMNQIMDCDIFIASAAVADYRPTTIANQKIKKSTLSVIPLEINPDILMEISKLPNRPFLMGFAAETENLISHAKNKFQQKNLDMMVANLVGKKDNLSSSVISSKAENHSGFYSDFNEVIVITSDEELPIPKMSKQQLASKLFSLIVTEYEKKQHEPALGAIDE